MSTVGRVVGQARRFSREIAQGVKRSAEVMQQTALEGLRKELDTFVPRVQQVMRQAKQRIFGGDTHVAEKLVSIFETTTEIIRKGKASKPTEFGKLVKIQEAENQIIIDFEVYENRPSDSELVIPALDVHEKTLGCTPRLVAGDAAFYSAKNEAAAHDRGVKRVFGVAPAVLGFTLGHRYSRLLRCLRNQPSRPVQCDGGGAIRRLGEGKLL